VPQQEVLEVLQQQQQEGQGAADIAAGAVAAAVVEEAREKGEDMQPGFLHQTGQVRMLLPGGPFSLECLGSTPWLHPLAAPPAFHRTAVLGASDLQSTEAAFCLDSGAAVTIRN
jgi:hypothetical protein